MGWLQDKLKDGREQLHAVFGGLQNKDGLKLPNVASILIWSVGLVFLLGLTIRDFMPLLEEYRFNNVALQVDVIAVDEHFKPPQLVVGIPWYKNENREDEDLMAIVRYMRNSTVKCDICKKLTENGWDVWNQTDLSKYLEGGPEVLYGAISLEFTRRLLPVLSNPNENILDKKFSSWNSPIFYSTMNYLLWRSKTDVEVRPSFPSGTAGQNLQRTLDTLTNSTELDLIFEKFLETLCEKITFSEITLNYLEIDYNIGKASARDCRALLFDDSQMISLEEKSGLWLVLPAQTYPKMMRYQFILSDNDHPLWTMKNSSTPRKPFGVYPDLNALYSTALDSLYMYYIAQESGHSSGLNVTVRYSVQMRARDTRSGWTTCHNQTITTCFAKCTKERILKECGCVPFTLKQGLVYDPALPYCTYAMYQTCDIAPITEDQKTRCLDQCKNACEYTSYNWQISRKSYEGGGAWNQTEFNLELFPVFTPFAEFRWTVKDTQERFFSQVGAIVNFYLGFSGLSVFAFIIFCIGFLQRCAHMRRKPNGGERNMDQLSEWKRSREVQMVKRKGRSIEIKERYISDDEPAFFQKHEREITSLRHQITELVHTVKSLEDKLEGRGSTAWF